MSLAKKWDDLYAFEKKKWDEFKALNLRAKFYDILESLKDEDELSDLFENVSH